MQCAHFCLQILQRHIGVGAVQDIQNTQILAGQAAQLLYRRIILDIDTHICHFHLNTGQITQGVHCLGQVRGTHHQGDQQTHCHDTACDHSACLAHIPGQQAYAQHKQQEYAGSHQQQLAGKQLGSHEDSHEQSHSHGQQNRDQQTRKSAGKRFLHSLPPL